MDFSIPCDCGQEIVASEGDAGARIPCNCGRIVAIPSLGVLRTRIGLPAVEPSLEIEVWSKLESGELPPTNCIGCGQEVYRISYVAECEHIHEQTSHDKWPLFQGVVAALGLFTDSLIFAFRIDGRDETVTTVHGREVHIPVPVHCCPSCRDTVICEPTDVFLKRIGSVLLWTGLFSMLLFSYVLGTITAAAGIGLQWVVWNQQVHFQRRLKGLLGNIPFYSRVFKKYPDALVRRQ